ncbi:MAG: ATP-binding cassette domain-containing protein [Candidatus Kariarchaeaceae archaeon]
MAYNDNNLVIQAVDLYKIYKSSEIEIPVIKGISLSVYSGDKLILIGPSGSGKTTLVSMLTGHINPTAGQVFWKGAPKEINNMSKPEMIDLRRSFLGFISQESALFPHLTVKENIILTSRIARMKFNQVEDQYKRLIDLLDITHLENRKGNLLSGGEAKRVNIASALITNPEILIGDEPVADLDPLSAFEILNLFDVINEELDTAFILTTHDQAVAERGDRILELRDGVLSGAHQNTLNLWDLDESRRIPVDSSGRISIPPEIFRQLKSPDFLKIELENGSIKLTPDYEVQKLFKSETIRECQNCTTIGDDKFCPKCGYPTILVK